MDPKETSEASPPSEPIGEVILGLKDPRAMSPDEFSHSSDILYHGSADAFEFSQDHTIDFLTSPNSHMLGPGFYATPNRQDAVWFSEAFQGFSKDKERVVVDVLPFQARMFDFRKKDDPTHNAFTPPDIVEGYRRFVIDQFNVNFKDFDPEAERLAVNNAPKFPVANTHPLDSYFPPKEDVDADMQRRRRKLLAFSMQREYQSFLNSIMGKTNVDLRSMLAIDGDSSKSEFGASIFKDYMAERGFDGIIYREGGDHPEHRKTKPVSYVFYNLKKVGTYDSWHQNLE